MRVTLMGDVFIACAICRLQRESFRCACERHQRQKPPWSLSIWQALDSAHDRLVPSLEQDPTAWELMYVRARRALEMMDVDLAGALDANARIAENLETEEDSPHGLLREVERRAASARNATSALKAADEEALINRICFQFAQTHDTSELWSHMRRDPEAFRIAIRRALQGGLKEADSKEAVVVETGANRQPLRAGDARSLLDPEAPNAKGSAAMYTRRPEMEAAPSGSSAAFISAYLPPAPPLVPQPSSEVMSDAIARDCAVNMLRSTIAWVPVERPSAALAAKVLELLVRRPPPELAPQPPPAKPPEGEPVWPLVISEAEYAGEDPRLIEMMRARDTQGRAKYGAPLSALDGRNTARGALQKALDLIVYLRKLVCERGMGVSWSAPVREACDIAKKIMRLNDAGG